MSHSNASLRKDERGSALTEAAIIIPVLIVLLFWAIAMTDIMVLRVKTAEASRFALWESTVFRSQAQISADVAQRFRDLRSPQTINTEYTGLLLYPQATNMILSATVNQSNTVSIGGKVKLDNPTGLIDKFLSLLLGVVSGTVDGATRFFQFNTRGSASASVTLVRASHIGSKIMMGGNLLGDKGGDDLDHSELMQNLTFRSPVAGHNPMRLVFDTWKAWPKPAAYTSNGGKTNTAVSPTATYQTVEEQVSAQVDKIAFYGARQSGIISAIDDFMSKVNSSGVMNLLFGGTMPSILATSRMDSNTRGPITIRPVAQPDASWVPGYTPPGGLEAGSQRLGELATYGSPKAADSPRTSLIAGQDQTRYTVPYIINSQYFTDNGGGDRDVFNTKHKALKSTLSRTNEYVKTYQCRGHYFAGGTTSEQTDFAKRYRPNCYSTN